MANGEEDCNCKRWDLEYQEENRYAVAIVHSHFIEYSEKNREEARQWSRGFRRAGGIVQRGQAPTLLWIERRVWSHD